MRRYRHVLPLVVLLAGLAVAWGSGLDASAAWAGLGRNQAELRQWVAGHKLTAPAAYVVIYIVSVALSIPASAVLTATGGLLFGMVGGGCLAAAAATAGSTILFLAARSALAGVLARRGGRTTQALRDRLRRDGFLYLLAIRLVPLFPFWLVNLAAALGGIRLTHYLIATLIGMLPVTFVISGIGAGIGDVLAAGGKPDLTILFAPHILGPLVALAALSLLPLLLRRLRPADA